MVSILGWAFVDTITRVDDNTTKIAAQSSRIAALETDAERFDKRLDIAIDRIIQMMTGDRDAPRRNKETTWPQTP